jgi:hypothetical protein
MELVTALLVGLLGTGCGDPTARARGAMVDSQIAARGVKDARVLSVMREVPRHLFVPAEQVAEA